MKTKEELKQVVKSFNALCKADKFKEAGELARENKHIFIDFVKNANNANLLYAYRVCDIFNMTQTQCYNLKDRLFN